MGGRDLSARAITCHLPGHHVTTVVHIPFCYRSISSAGRVLQGLSRLESKAPVATAGGDGPVSVHNLVQQDTSEVLRDGF